MGDTLTYWIRRLFSTKKKVASDNDTNKLIFNTNNVLISSDFNIRGELYVLNNGSIKIGSNFLANSGVNYNPIGGDIVLRLVTYRPSARILIGDNVGISNSTILAWGEVKIGNHVMIGGGVKIWDTDFHSLDPIIRTSNKHKYDYDVKVAPVFIDDYAFIGAGSTICKGVTIGKNSVIGAGSVVVKSIPDNVVAAGNPCKVIRNL